MRVTRVDLSAHCNNYWILEVVCSFRFSGEVVRIWLTLDITRQWQRASSGCLYDDQSRVPLVARGPGLLSFSCALCGNSDQWPAGRQSERPPVFYSGDRDRAVTPRPLDTRHCATRDSWQSVTKCLVPVTLCDNGTSHYHNLYRKYHGELPGKVATRAWNKERTSEKKTTQLNINVVCDWQGQESWQIMNPIIKLIDDMIIFDHQLTFHDFIDWNRNGFTKTHIHIQLTDCWAMFMANSIWAFTWQSIRLRTVFIPVNVG